MPGSIVSVARVCALVGAVLVVIAASAGVAVLAGSAMPAGASAATPTQPISSDGYRLTVPPGWPVNHPARSAVRTALYRAATVKRRRATARAAAATPGQVYTGTGFDACSTPSRHAMSAWSRAYRVAAVYIGGTNMGCPQPNLTRGWVSAESAAGWHLVPVYVGLQAPSNSCSCAAISPRSAGAQGAGAAHNAVARALARGLGPGNPIYFDMEAYPRTSRNRAAVLTFLAAWTAKLHELGYISGVYGSDGSGAANLAAAAASGHRVTDDLWFANWNHRKTTADPVVPTGTWPDHQRVHQYRGPHNETHGGVTLSIDSDYIDAPTAAIGGAVVASTHPSRPGVRRGRRGQARRPAARRPAHRARAR